MSDAAGGDVSRVRAALDAGALLHPDEGATSLVHLAQAMASLAGAPIDGSDDRVKELARLIGQHEHYVFVLADGLGMNLVERLPDDAWFRAHLARELRAVFPSSTAPSLTSIATARWPAEHAVAGWWTYLPEAGVTATILPFVERFSEQPLEQLGIDASQAFPVDALAGRYTHAYASFTPRRIANSSYSRYSTSNAPCTGYDKLSEGIDAIVERVRSARQPTFSYLYVPHVDYEEHLHGPDARESARAVEYAQGRLARLARETRGGARIVVTADHGLMTVGQMHVLEPDDEMIAHLRVPPTGDGRGPIFHARSSAHSSFAETFQRRFGDRFALLTTTEAEALGLFGGALSAETRRRAGDFIGVALADDVIIYERTKDAALRGHHGGLSPAEMRIPLILA